MPILEALFKVVPVLLLLLLGGFLRRRRFLQPETVADLKNLIVSIALPALLFLAFARVNLESRHLLIVAVVFSACLLVLLLSRRFRPLDLFPSPFFPTLMAGFEAGMMGYAIFASVYGAENVFKFGVIDLGQVAFVFFVLAPLLERQATGARPFRHTLASFLKTPVILAILGGILVNRSGLIGLLDSGPLGASLLEALRLLSALTTPLVALVIGYEMRLQAGALGRPLGTVALRLALWAPAALLFNVLVIDRLLGLDAGFQAAVMTMAILPPPFVVPLFMPCAGPEDRAYVVNTLSIATLVTLFAFALVGALYR